MKNVIVKNIIIKGKDWENSLDEAFKKDVKNVNLDGFRKGSIPKDVFIKKFGIESLYRDAVDIALQSAYTKLFAENKDITPVTEPKIDVKDINESEVNFEFTIITHPEVTLGAYKKLGVKKSDAKVTKKELDEEIEKLRSRFAEIVVKDNGEVAEGNTAVIDFEGIVDGKKLDGGSGENYPLEIGSHTFIPGFEEGIVGMKKGESKELNLKFPENYTDALKNKDVTFKVTVEEIKERVLPAINEDFYEDLGYKDLKSVEEFNKKVESDVLARKNNQEEDKYIDACLDAAVKNMKVEINPEIIDEEIHRMMHQFEDQLKPQGITLEQYLEFSKMTMEAFHKQLEPEATKRIQTRYLLESIAEKEGVDFKDEEVEAQAEKMAANYGITKDELIKEFGGIEVVKYDMKMRKALEIVKEA